MRWLLKYYYNMLNPTIYRVGKNIHIRNNNINYMLCEINNIIEFDEIINLLHTNKIINEYDQIVKTITQENRITYQNKNYVLLRKKTNKNTLEERIINQSSNNKKTVINTNYLYKLDCSNWYFLWTKKTDNLYENMQYEKRRDTYIDEVIDYYIGLAENAITYLKIIKDSKSELYISHRRVEKKYYNDPLNIVLDRKERDIAEYIKYMFFNNRKKLEHNMNRIQELIKKEALSFEYIYARLLYPTYFFDLYENIDNKEEYVLGMKKLIKNINEYELFLKKLQQVFSRYIEIKKIDWL